MVMMLTNKCRHTHLVPVASGYSLTELVLPKVADCSFMPQGTENSQLVSALVTLHKCNLFFFFFWQAKVSPKQQHRYPLLSTTFMPTLSIGLLFLIIGALTDPLEAIHCRSLGQILKMMVLH